MAHVASQPAEIAVIPESSPPEEGSTTSTGVDLFVVVPSPSWPSELYPQHFTPPKEVSHEHLGPVGAHTQRVCLVAAVCGSVVALRPQRCPGGGVISHGGVVVAAPRSPGAERHQDLRRRVGAHKQRADLV